MREPGPPEDTSLEAVDEGELSDAIKGRVLREQKSDREINEAVLRPMLEAGRGFWVLTGVLSAIVLWGLFAWGYMIYWGMGVAGVNRPVCWGFFFPPLCFSGSHLPPPKQ